MSARSSSVTEVQRKRGAEVEKRSGCSDLSGIPRASGRDSSESVSRDVSFLHRVAVEHHFGEAGRAKRKPESVKKAVRSEGKSPIALRPCCAQVPRMANGWGGIRRVRDHRESGIEEVLRSSPQFSIHDLLIELSRDED